MSINKFPGEHRGGHEELSINPRSEMGHREGETDERVIDPAKAEFMAYAEHQIRCRIVDAKAAGLQPELIRTLEEMAGTEAEKADVLYETVRQHVDQSIAAAMVNVEGVSTIDNVQPDLEGLIQMELKRRSGQMAYGRLEVSTRYMNIDGREKRIFVRYITNNPAERV